MQNIIDKILANPGRAIGIVFAVILAVVQTLVGQGVIAPNTTQTVQNLLALAAILITAFFPSWGPIVAAAKRHGA
jgi:hypothetical protein